MTEGRTGLRLKVLAGLVLFMFAALSIRLWFLQVLATDWARDQASRNSVRVVALPAPRGRILDDKGNVLVGNEQSVVVTINRSQVAGQEEQVLYRLSQLLNISVGTLVGRMNDKRYYPYQPVPVAAGVPRNAVFYIAEHEKEFPGVRWADEPVRTYPSGSLGAQIFGYLGYISPGQLKDPAFADYGQNDLVGQTGLEAVYEHRLVGTKGFVKYRVNAAGENIRQIGREDPVPGADLVLSLDANTERLATDSLASGLRYARGVFDRSTGKHLQATSGAVVIMDPKTGAIQALVSLPTYDPRVFVGGISSRELRQLVADRSGNRLLDRTIAGQYPPGSTYKPFMALSGLRDGIVNMSQGYHCASTYTVGGQVGTSQTTWHNWTTRDLGYMNLARALVASCDTVFYPIGYSYWGVYYPPTQPPRLPLQRDLHALGFGRPTHIDLPAEQDGRVPDPAWKAEYHHRYPKAFPEGNWYPGDFVNMSIGQGDTLVSPIQVAAAYSAIANGGRLCQPHVAARVQTSDGELVRRYEPRCRKLPFRPQQVAYVRNALAGVPVSGTAQFAFRSFPFSRVWVAGKTGTAQQYGKQDTSWFAAMTKAGGEQHLIVCVVEQGGHG